VTITEKKMERMNKTRSFIGYSMVEMEKGESRWGIDKRCINVYFEQLIADR